LEGWSGPYTDGCSYYWDGYGFTGDVDCSGAGTAGWYGPYTDGCLYWWDGYRFTGAVDCTQAGALLDDFVGYSSGGSTAADGDAGPGLLDDFVGYPSGVSWQPTGYSEIDAIMMNMFFGGVAAWVRPTCAYTVGTTCYTS